MRLIACLSWYDEPPGMLRAAVRSLATAGTTHLVALDGAYALYRGGRAESPRGQAEAIRAEAADCGLRAAVHVPPAVWRGEVEKRTELLRLAHEMAEPEEDWLLVADADERWEARRPLTDLLREERRDVVEATMRDPLLDGGWAERVLRRLYRTQPGGIFVERHHGRYVTRDGTVLWDADRPESQVPATYRADVRVVHDARARSVDRAMAQTTYYMACLWVGIEACR